RVYTYIAELGWGPLNLLATAGAVLLAVSVLIFLLNVFLSLRSDVPAPADPWGGDSLEWSVESPPPNYNFHPLPTVTGLYPRWDVGGEKPPVVEGVRADRREVLVTHFMDAEPDYRQILPAPSFAPLLLALGTSVAFLGVVYAFWWVPIGGLLSFAAIVKWFWPGEFEGEPPWSETH